MLGFETPSQGNRVRIRDIVYTGVEKNEYLSFDYHGLPPSIIKLLSLSAAIVKKDSQGNESSEQVPKQDKNTFKHFASFMADN